MGHRNGRTEKRRRRDRHREHGEIGRWPHLPKWIGSGRTPDGLTYAQTYRLSLMYIKEQLNGRVSDVLNGVRS